MAMSGGIEGAETYCATPELSPGQRAISVSGFAESVRTPEGERLGAGADIREPVTAEKLV